MSSVVAISSITSNSVKSTYDMKEFLWAFHKVLNKLSLAILTFGTKIEAKNACKNCQKLVEKMDEIELLLMSAPYGKHINIRRYRDMMADTVLPTIQHWILTGDPIVEEIRLVNDTIGVIVNGIHLISNHVLGMYYRV